MAHTEQISSLLEGLIDSHTTGLSPVDIEQRKRAALQTFARDSSGRTNQFQVTARLQGLVEKFRILNKDILADALQSRLEEVEGRSDRWTPEILSLFLHLSERPTLNSRMEELTWLETENNFPPLTWSDIIADDPLDDDTNLWKEVDFAADDPDGDELVEEAIFESSDPDEGPGTPQSEDTDARLEALIIPIQKSQISSLEDAQYWKTRAITSHELAPGGNEDDPKVLLTEFQAVREVIFMLLGLPNSISSTFPGGPWTVSHNINIRHASQELIKNLLDKFANTGTKLLVIRRWIQKDENIPLEQKFQDITSSRLRKFDSVLHNIQTRILNSSRPYTSSLLALYDEVHRECRLIGQLHSILLLLDQAPKAQRPFRILECLYDYTCDNHSVGDAEGYDYTGTIFFECLRTYLKSIRIWMETGRLEKHDPVMFVGCNEKRIPLESLWQDQFYLIHDTDGNLHAPNFLRLAAKKIFNTGKSVVFLNHLDISPAEIHPESLTESSMTFHSVCKSPDPQMLHPFPELFDSAFETWISALHHSSSSLLRHHLESRCGLYRSLSALEQIYLFPTSTTTHHLQSHLSNPHQPPPDSLTLTELFRNAYATNPEIDPHRLTVRIPPHHSTPTPRPTPPLSTIQITYTLPWPIANILPHTHIPTLQQIHHLLTHLHRSKHLLQSRKPPPSAPGPFYALRARVLWFVNAVLTHLVSLVLGVEARAMREEMGRAEDVDAMRGVLEGYVRRIEGGCFVGPSGERLRRAVVAVGELGVGVGEMVGGGDGKGWGEGGRGGGSDDEDEDGGGGHLGSGNADGDGGGGVLAADLRHAEGRIGKMRETFDQLVAFVAATVQGIAKADGGGCWEILAGSLAAGVEV